MESAPHALEFLKQAADSCYAPAQYEYAIMLLNGEGTEASPETAVHWLEKAAEQEHVDAKTELAKCYLGGIGVPTDTVVAGRLLREAASAGNNEALFLYAQFMRDTGLRVIPSWGLRSTVCCLPPTAAMPMLLLLSLNTINRLATTIKYMYMPARCTSKATSAVQSPLPTVT